MPQMTWRSSGFEPASPAVASLTMRRAWELLVQPIAGIGCCVSPQPSFDSDISEGARRWRACSRGQPAVSFPLKICEALVRKKGDQDVRSNTPYRGFYRRIRSDLNVEDVLGNYRLTVKV